MTTFGRRWTTWPRRHSSTASRPRQAHERLQHAVHNYPVSYYSYLGLVQLLEAGVEVDDLDRGLTDYYAGVYDKALEALDRYIADNPGNDGTAVLPSRFQP